MKAQLMVTRAIKADFLSTVKDTLRISIAKRLAFPPCQKSRSLLTRRKFPDEPAFDGKILFTQVQEPENFL